MDGLEGYLPVRIAAERKGMPYTTLKGWVMRGVVPSIKVGRDRFVKMEDVEMIAIREEGRPRRTVTVTPPDMWMHTWGGLKEHLLDTTTPEEVRAAYDELVAFYERPGVLTATYPGAPQTAAQAAWGAICEYLPTLPDDKVRLIVPVLDQTVRERKDQDD